MTSTITPGVLTIGLFDETFSHNASATAHQVPPSSVRYVPCVDDPAEVDVVLVTPGRYLVAAPYITHPRRVLWLLENREFEPHPPLTTMRQFDLVLTNDADVIAAIGARAAWLSLIGTWLPRLDVDWVTGKTASVSMLANIKSMTSGHRLRHAIAAEIPPSPETYDGYGCLFGQSYQPSKLPALVPYRFTIAIEPAAYNHFYTEKLFDAFAARTIPVYWGPPDLAPLTALGFDITGILPWQTVTGLRERLAVIAQRGPVMYEERAAAIATNYDRARALYCPETLLGPLLRRHFGLE